MKTIRRLMRASTFDGANSLYAFFKRAAWIGLIWANFLALIASGIILTACAAAFCYVAYKGAPLGGIIKPFGAIPAIYLLVRGWGVVIGAGLGAVRCLIHRAASTASKSGG